MKICMPTQGSNGLREEVYSHFGSANYFTIYDTETKELKMVENNNNHHHHGQCHPLSAIEGFDVGAVLTNGMGKRAVSKLNSGGVKVYLLDEDNVEGAIAKFTEGLLTELTVDNACGGHGHGRGHGNHEHQHGH